MEIIFSLADSARAAFQYRDTCTKLVCIRGCRPLNLNENMPILSALKELIIEFRDGYEDFAAEAQHFPALRRLEACLGTNTTRFLQFITQLTSLSLTVELESDEQFNSLKSSLNLGKSLVHLELDLEFDSVYADSEEVLNANTVLTTLHFPKLRSLALVIELDYSGICFQASALLIRSFVQPQLQSLSIYLKGD